MSPDGQTVISGGIFDGTIKNWNLKTGELLRTFTNVSLVAISADDQLLYFIKN